MLDIFLTSFSDQQKRWMGVEAQKRSRGDAENKAAEDQRMVVRVDRRLGWLNNM